MKKDNIIQNKSYAFAVKIIKTYQHLCTTQKEFVLSKQLLRCGTSIGANIEEAIGAQSDKDFYAKNAHTHFGVMVPSFCVKSICHSLNEYQKTLS